jgi:CRP/FNR family transcriptional regulator, cyclic AMP receptor protein
MPTAFPLLLRDKNPHIIIYSQEEPSTGNATIGKLRDISFFADMSDHDLAQIAAITTERSYAPGAVIIEEMTEAERFFIIHRGKIEITKRFEGSEGFVLSVQSDGDFFGEMALLDEGRRSATVRALEPTTVLEISRSDFETLLYKAPVLAYRILKELSARLRETGALLISHLKQRNRQLLRAYIETMTIVVRSIEPKGDAAPRVADLVASLGRELGIGDDDFLIIELGALLHDLGSFASPERPALERIIPQMLKEQGGFEGIGFPEALAGGPSPRADRLIALADAYVAMAPKGKAQIDSAIRSLREGIPDRFDKEAVAALARIATSL